MSCLCILECKSLLVASSCKYFLPFCRLSFHIVFGFFWASMVAQMGKNLPAMQETQVQSLGQEDPLEKGIATYPSILAQKIIWREEPSGLQSMGSQRVRHDWITLSLLWFPLLCKRLYIWLSLTCLFLLLFLLPWESDLRKYCFDLCQGTFCLCSLLQSFMESFLIFKSLSHFEFIV